MLFMAVILLLFFAAFESFNDAFAAEPPMLMPGSLKFQTPTQLPPFTTKILDERLKKVTIPTYYKKRAHHS